METGQWIECKADTDYEINTEYPYHIRRKGSDKVITESDSDFGYPRCKLNGKDYKKHRIVALQFIPNPNNYPQVDHINHNRADYHIENLRWVTASENQRNKTGYAGKDFILHDELPDTAERLDAYNGHWFDGLYIDYENEKLYLFNGVNYRELVPRLHGGSIRYLVTDMEGKRRDLSHGVLFG